MRETNSPQDISHRDLPVLTSHLLPNTPKTQGSSQPEQGLAVHPILVIKQQLRDGPKMRDLRYPQSLRASNKGLFDQNMINYLIN